MDDTASRPRGRPQAPEVTGRILAATLKLVAENGYAGLRIEDVAAACGTSKQAIYRRWPSKPDLVAAAIEETLAEANPAPASDDFIEALTIALAKVAALVNDTPFGAAIAALLGVPGEHVLVEALQRVEARRRGFMQALFRRAQATGAYAARREIEIDIDALLGAIYFRALIRRQPVDAAFVAALVRQWASGLEGECA